MTNKQRFFREMQQKVPGSQVIDQGAGSFTLRVPKPDHVESKIGGIDDWVKEVYPQKNVANIRWGSGEDHAEVVINDNVQDLND